MRNYFTISQTVVLRTRDELYLGEVQSEYVARRLGLVLQLGPVEVLALSSRLRGDSDGFSIIDELLTPAELRTVIGFEDWFVSDGRKAFTAINLNTGLSITFLKRTGLTRSVKGGVREEGTL